MQLESGNSLIQEVIIKKPRVVIKEAQVLPRNQWNPGVPTRRNAEVVFKEVRFDVGGQSARIPAVSHNHDIEQNVALPKQAAEGPVQLLGTISHGQHNDTNDGQVS
ncbi:hypothetical protein GCM10009715_25290 [Paeniglutamicibacter psychrophenolicus]